MTEQEISDITGIQPSNLVCFESGGKVPTLVVLEKYANAMPGEVSLAHNGALFLDELAELSRRTLE